VGYVLILRTGVHRRFAAPEARLSRLTWVEKTLIEPVGASSRELGTAATASAA
jgi:hypothetical protein